MLCVNENFIVVLEPENCLAIDFAICEPGINMAVLGMLPCKLVFPLAFSKSVFTVLFDLVHRIISKIRRKFSYLLVYS